MKKIISFLAIASLATFSTVSVIAQDAKAILEKVSNKYKASTAMKANFELTMYDVKGTKKATQKGEILLKGNKYKILAGNQEITSDGKTLWTYSKKDNEVMVDNVSANSISPAKLFAGSYEKEYNYKSAGSTIINNKAANVIELTPKTAQQGFKKVDLFVDKATNAILGGNIYDKSGSYMQYTLSNTSYNTPLTDAQLTFDTKQHAGVDVIDLR